MAQFLGLVVIALAFLVGDSQQTIQRIINVRPKVSLERVPVNESFPFSSCEESVDEDDCSGLIDYIRHFCPGPDKVRKVLSNTTVVLNLLPGVHKLRLWRIGFPSRWHTGTSCSAHLVIRSEDASGTTILATGLKPSEIPSYVKHVGPSWTILAFSRSKVDIENITFRSEWWMPGQVFISCYSLSECRISNCRFLDLNHKRAALLVRYLGNPDGKTLTSVVTNSEFLFQQETLTTSDLEKTPFMPSIFVLGATLSAPNCGQAKFIVEIHNCSFLQRMATNASAPTHSPPASFPDFDPYYTTVR